MIHLSEYISSELDLDYVHPHDIICEMATIGAGVPLGKRSVRYDVKIHGFDTKERNSSPHIHIYKEGIPDSEFNFEVSLCDIICKNELNLIKQIDRSAGIRRANRRECSWDGYSKLKRDFIKWLFSIDVDMRGDYADNLDALISSFNFESRSIMHSKNALLDYINAHDMQVLDGYAPYMHDWDEIISVDDIKKHRERHNTYLR